MKLSWTLLSASFALACAIAACGGSTPPASSADVPGADSSAAPVDPSELEADGPPCPEGSPDCGS